MNIIDSEVMVVRGYTIYAVCLASIDFKAMIDELAEIANNTLAAFDITCDFAKMKRTGISVPVARVPATAKLFHRLKVPDEYTVLVVLDAQITEYPLFELN